MFARLRWLSVVVPVVLVATIETISDTWLDPNLPFPLDTILISLVVLASAATLSWLAFREVDRLTGALRSRNEELARRTATARGLEQVAVSVAGGGAIEATLQVVVQRARDLLQADVAMLAAAPTGIQPLWLSDPPGAAAAIAASARPDEAPAFAVADPLGIDQRLEAIGGASRLVSPVRLGTDVVGQVGVGVRRSRAFDVDDVETLNGLASMAAVAIRNDDLRERLRGVAIQGERERIAREMHDGLAQVLAYASAKSAAAEELLASGKNDAARDQMAELGRIARSTYVDVRESIVGLANPISPGDGFATVVADYGRRFAEISKLVVDVVASDDAEQAALAPEAQAQAFRIVQEALTNIRKHAHASRVRITLERAGDDLEVAVEDDGLGVRADVGGAQDWPHFGLATMAARAAEAGGTVTWSDRDGGGTRVMLRLPMSTAPALTATA